MSDKLPFSDKLYSIFGMERQHNLTFADVVADDQARRVAIELTIPEIMQIISPQAEIPNE